MYHFMYKNNKTYISVRQLSYIILAFKKHNLIIELSILCKWCLQIFDKTLLIEMAFYVLWVQISSFSSPILLSEFNPT